MPKINSIKIPVCECLYADGAIKFTAVINYDELPPDRISYYIVDPSSDKEILFYTWALTFPSTFNNEIGKSITSIVSGTENKEVIKKIVTKRGLRTYSVITKPTYEDGTGGWDGTKIFSKTDVQFSDVFTSITFKQDVSDDVSKLSFSASYWNNDCMILTVKSPLASTDQVVSFNWDDINGKWLGSLNIDISSLACGQEIQLQILGEYKASSACPSLPCKAWKYNKTVKIKGNCMNTNYPLGLHILQDVTGDDKPCNIIKSLKSGHLICLFTSIRTADYCSVYVRVLSSQGALSPAILVPDVTDNNQYDADVTPIHGTDDFFVVWTSNAQSTDNRIYGRRFTINSSGHAVPSSPAIQISQSNGAYVAPRVVYNHSIDKFFVTWISVAEKEVQSIYLNNDEDTTHATYQGGVKGQIAESYYSKSLDLQNNNSLSLSLFNAKDKSLVAYKDLQNNIMILQYGFEKGKAPVPVSLPTYEVESLETFDFAFDDINSNIKVVYNVTTDPSVYGDTLDYFANSHNKFFAGSPVRLNQSNQECTRPRIEKTTPVVNGTKRYRNFIVSWETAEAAIFYNIFDSSYSQISSEQEVNSGDKNSSNVRIAVTENQFALAFQAKKFNSEPLSQLGLLYYVANRTDKL